MGARGVAASGTRARAGRRVWGVPKTGRRDGVSHHGAAHGGGVGAENAAFSTV
jgi:hypothetical protein